ncbi:MAG: hypothetical protein ABSE42_23130 [Bryobacteraceae bacterium]|jgi:hypothetical protein
MASAMPSTKVTSTKGAAIAVTHSLVGWVLCGATMALGMKVTTLETALILHAFAVPLIFTALSLIYFRRLESWPPFRTAVTFVGVVIIMDVVVVALLIQRSLDMFESVLGTWLPFLLIFFSTWWTGIAVRRLTHRAAH